MHHRTLELLASTLITIAIPMGILMLFTILKGKIAALLFLSALSNCAFLSGAAGYALADTLNWDRFNAPLIFGFASLFVFGLPLAMAFMP